MQAGLALAGGLLGIWAWLKAGDMGLLIAALLLLAVIPFTLFVIMPTNKRLMATPPAAADGETRRLLERWGRLHWARNLLGLASVIAFLCFITLN